MNFCLHRGLYQDAYGLYECPHCGKIGHAHTFGLQGLVRKLRTRFGFWRCRHGWHTPFEYTYKDEHRRDCAYCAKDLT